MGKNITAELVKPVAETKHEEFIANMRDSLRLNFPGVTFEDDSLKVGSKIILSSGVKMVIAAHCEDGIDLEYEDNSPPPVGYKMIDGQGREMVVTRSDGDIIEVEYC